MRRMVSLPPVATLNEPNDSDDEDENDDDAGASSSHIMRSSVSAASTVPRGAVGEPVASPTSLLNRPPPGTQPASSSNNTSTLDSFDGSPGKRRLALLNKPGKGQTQTGRVGASSSSSGTGMPPPSQSASQMAKERVQSSSSAQPAAPRSEPGPFAISSIIPSLKGSSTSPIKNSVQPPQTQPSSSRPLSASQPQPRPRISNSVSAPVLTQPSQTSSTSGSGKGKGREICIEIEDSDDDTMGASRTQVPPRPKPRKKVDSASKSSTPSKSPQVVNFLIFRIAQRTHEMQKPNSFEQTLSTSSGDEFPFSLSQSVRLPDKNQSPRKPSAATSPISNHPTRIREEDSGDEIASSISQASRKRVSDDRRTIQTVPSSRDRSDKNKEASKTLPMSVSIGGSTLAQQDLKEKPRRQKMSFRKSTGGVIRHRDTLPGSFGNRHKGPTPSSRHGSHADRKIASSSTQTTSNRADLSRPISSSQPSSVSNKKAGPSQPPPSTQPISARTSGSSARQKTSISGSVSHASPSKPKIRDLGVVEISDDEDTRPATKITASGLNGSLIDLTLDDDDDDVLPVSTPSLRPANAPKATTSNNSALAQLNEQNVSESRPAGSPPAVRPKPRVSAIPKEKMADPKPQPANSRPLDKSRRRSDTAASGSGNRSSSSWLLDENGSDPEPGLIQAKRNNARAVDILSPIRGGEGEFKQNDVTSNRNFPVLDKPFSPVRNAEESESAEPNFDTFNDEPMDIEPLYDNDGPAENALVAAVAPSNNDTMTVENFISLSEQRMDDADEKKPEETTAPIERARELRSPPVVQQAKESQSQAEDANEVDLLLGPSLDCISATEVVEAEKPEVLQPSVSFSSQGEANKKPETLTDKLGMLDLSRPASAPLDGQEGQQLDLDVLMEDHDKLGPPEDSGGVSAPGVVPVSPAVSAGPSKRAASEEMKTNETEGAASAGVALPAASSFISEPVPRVVSSSPAIQEKYTRAISPGAYHVPKPTPNFKGMFYGKNAPSPTSPSKRFKLPMMAIDDKPSESEQSDSPALLGRKTDKMLSDVGDVHMKPVASNVQTSCVVAASMSESAFKSGETKTSANLPVIDREESSTPSSSSGVDSRSTSLLSPRSRAKLRIPDVRPPRKLNINQPITLTHLRAKTQANTNESSSSSSPPPLSGSPKSKEAHQSSTECTVRSSPEAVASARRLAELHPAFVDLARAKANPTPTTSMLKEANSTDSVRPDSTRMSYVWNTMKKHEMQSPDPSAAGTSVKGASSLPTQTEPASTHQPASPKTAKIHHTPENQKILSPKSVTSTTVILTDSGEVTPVLKTSVSNEVSASIEISASSTGNGPDIAAAPHIRHQVARKSLPKRRPKMNPSSSDPSVRNIEHSLKETSIYISKSQRQPRKRTLSSASKVSSTDDDEENISYRKVSFKRARVHSSGASADDGLFSSSTDPMDLLDTRGDSHDEDSDSSVIQPTTPVTGLAGAVQNIVISKDPNYRGGVEVDRYFMDRDRGPIWYHVDDIPTDLINEVNAIPAWSRNPTLLRQIFETAMMQNTIDDEPDAPLIKIINNVDDEPTPPFEFYYTNRIYHGHGVPPPEYRTLKGCKCIGRCNPLSGTCECAVRQRKIFKDHDYDHEGFVYDDKGRVQVDGFPIFECNDACGCSEDCTNRVVQLGRQCHVNIVKTRNKGWGVFAGKKIQKGTYIGIYSGEILLQSESIERGLVYNKIGKTYLFDIDFWHITTEDQDAKYTMDAYHVGNFTRFLNHSCDPNCKINAVHINDANIEKALLGIFALKDIDAGQELTFNYYGEMDEENKDKGEDQAYQKCLCGARNCYGKLFTFSSAPAE
ncbi:hypothetical protein ACEPAH_238 [Sanghuangporus vaninii]